MREEKSRKKTKNDLKEASKKIEKCIEAGKIQKTRKDPTHIARIQRHQEYLEHQISKEKDTHPKGKK